MPLNYIFAPSYNFNIVAGQNFVVQSSLGDESSGVVNGSPGVGTSAVSHHRTRYGYLLRNR